MEPVDVVPTHQSMLAEKLAALALLVSGVKVATVPLNVWLKTVLRIVPEAWTLAGAGVTLARDWAVPVSLLVVLLTVTVRVKLSPPWPKPESGPSQTESSTLSRVYVWVPLTSKPPLGSAVTVPSEVVPSPQLIAAVNSPAVALELTSVKVATIPEKDWPAVAWMFWPLAVMIGGAGATLARLSAVAEVFV